MHGFSRSLTAASLLLWISTTDPSFAQKQGGILKMYHVDSPPSASIHEEAPSLPRSRSWAFSTIW